ncbi:YfiR family protein [Shewanella gelidii]|uniref:YfiR family protein n=1 Tax=Shewanella gelidii TaxID=1642821 RepID=A0A917JNI0_9GAMM|nr:YfiR family protein [Shewanella gelidii]MCL1097840.1 YfiR family protein [Shewanella gelidii]GGI78332.1 hypothetical protein GCM10009332_14660 [Shewanella gelidii]
MNPLKIVSGIFTVAFIWLGMTELQAAPKSSPQLASLKSAYIYNIAKFTRWPEGTWHRNDESLILCVYGRGDVVSELKKLEGKLVDSHPIVLNSPTEQAEFSKCHLLYISPQERKRFRYLFDLLPMRSLLTIGDDPSFISSGGMVNFKQLNKRLRFEVNMDQLRSSDLTFSSNLMKLAIQVEQQGGRR